MKKLYLLIFIVLSAIFIFACSSQIPESDSQSSAPDETHDDNLKEQNHTLFNPDEYPSDTIRDENIVYIGAFTLPDDGENEQDMFSWGGEAMCYNPANDSLFISGHAWYTHVAEISIPEAILSKDISQLNQSHIIQEFTDIKGSLFDKWTMEIPRAGLEVVDDKLFFCFGEHFEEGINLGTHGYTDTNLSESKKVCIAGEYLYSNNDYMFKIPDEYVAYFGGNDLFTGRFRDGGWSGMGPSLLAVSSIDIINAENNELISVSPVVKYEDTYLGDTGYKMNNYSHADSWTGGAFISCDVGNAIAFVGTHSYGSTWYGFSNGVVYPIDGEQDDVYPDVPPYPHDERGWWSDDFRSCMVLYDAADVIKVFEGKIPPYEIQPYAFIDLDEYMIIKRDETDMQYLGSAAYDAGNNRLFVLEQFADGDKPVVHVFTFE